MTDFSDRVILSDKVEAIHYDLDISTKLEGDFKFTGVVIIDLKLKAKDITQIQLHAKQLEIHSCSFKSTDDKEFVSKSQNYDEKDEIMTFIFESVLPEGNGKLSLEFTGVHNNEMAGFYRSGQPSRSGEQRIMVSTQFEPLDARRCFPCIDEPAQKATFTCALEVDKGLTALSNMPIIKEEAVNDKRTKVYFDKSPKMSSYLLAFCVGEFDYIETKTKHNVLLRVYTPVNKKELGEFALQIGSQNLDLYDSMFGKPFPLPKMDMIAIPEFAMGAMENWGLITYREVDLLIDPTVASSQQKQRVATVVAHELAHQWFGNLVTMRWWDDLWLNEGFATWMQNYATNDIYPEWKLWEQFINDSQDSALSLDSLLSSHPIQVKISRAQEVEEVFDLISYRKGSCVVQLINSFLGQKLFVEGLKLYMDRHAYGNTETIDLWNAWEEVSKKPINKIMASWTEQQGYPVVTVESADIKDGKCKLKLRQEWFLADGTVPEEKRWAIPMFAMTNKGETQLDLFTEDTATYEIELAQGGWLKLNANQVIIIRVNYTESLWKALFQAVAKKELSVVDRIGLILDAEALVKAKRLNPALFLELLRCYQDEESYAVWSALAGTLSGLNNVLKGQDELHEKFKALAKSLLLPAFKKVGWESKDSDGHLGKMLRSLLVGLLVTFAKNDPEVVVEARKKFEAYLKDPKTTAVPSEYRASIFRLVLSNSKTSKEYDALMSLIDKLATIGEKKDIYLTLGFIDSAELKLKTLEWCTSGAVKKQDFFYGMASVSMSGIEGAKLAWQYFKDNFNKIDEMLKTASPSLMGAAFQYSTVGFNSVEQAKDIESFFETHKTKIERKISQIVEVILSRAQYRDILLSSQEFKSCL